MQIEKLKLRKLNNTRDLGGFPAADGKYIVPGKLIRSGKLYKLPKITKKSLGAIGVSVVIDLRIDNEVKQYPPDMLEGTRYVHIPLLTTAKPGITYEGRSMPSLMKEESTLIETEFKDADEYMHKIYTDILFDGESQKSIRKVFDIFLTEPGCILFNCSGGKDRAGIIAMLLESVLGVPEDLVIQDYTASEVFQRRKRSTQKRLLKLVPGYRKFKELLIAFMEARPQYITDVLDTIKERYGSVTGYCKDALGLTDADIRLLRDKYLSESYKGPDTLDSKSCTHRPDIDT
ncbi:MAG: tyrosine-protein phosphatase [Clostridia bacterium]|nr:tyrosine-protein phosphatase [Clostridia bacterium]